MADLTEQEKWKSFSQGHQGLGFSENTEEFFVNYCKSTVDYLKPFHDYIEKVIPLTDDFISYRKEVSTPAIKRLFADFTNFDNAKKAGNNNQRAYLTYVALELELRGLLAEFGPLQIERFQIYQLGRFLYFATFHLYVLAYGVINGANFAISPDHASELRVLYQNRSPYYAKCALRKYNAGLKIIANKDAETIAKFREKCGILIFDHVNHWSFRLAALDNNEMQNRSFWYDILRFIDAEKLVNPATNMSVSNASVVRDYSATPFTEAVIANRLFTQKYSVDTFYLNPNQPRAVTQYIDCLSFTDKKNCLFQRDHVYPTHSSFFLQSGGYIQFDVKAPSGFKNINYFYYGLRYHNIKDNNNVVITLQKLGDPKIYYTSQKLPLEKCVANEDFNYHDYKTTFFMNDVMDIIEPSQSVIIRITGANVYIKSLILVPIEYGEYPNSTWYIIPKSGVFTG